MLLIIVINKKMLKKIRQTRQKQAINRELESFKTFFTINDLYERIKRKDKKIGIATLYRFLKELKKKNLICSYRCQERQIYSKSKNSHCHFRCQKCGNVKHISIGSIDFIKKNIKNSICHFQIDIEGICKDCEELK